MREFSTLIFALSAGVLLGAIFYGGLWWTVRSILSSGGPGIRLAGSFLVRALIAVGGFYFVSQGDLRRLLACLLGLLIGRIFVARLTRAPRGGKSRLIRGTRP